MRIMGFPDQKLKCFFFPVIGYKFLETGKFMAGGGAAPPPKQDELLPHPVKDQLPNIAYCITSPPPWREFSYFSLLL